MLILSVTIWYGTVLHVHVTLMIVYTLLKAVKVDPNAKEQIDCNFGAMQFHYLCHSSVVMHLNVHMIIIK